MNNKPSYDELMSLYLQEKQRNEQLTKENQQIVRETKKSEAQLKYETKKLERKNKHLSKELKKTRLENKRLNLKIEKILKLIEDKNIIIKEQLCNIFGFKSEKKNVIINEAEETADIEFKKDKKKRGRKPGSLDASKFDKSIIDTELVTLDQKNKRCDYCESDLVYIGDKILYKVEYIPAKVKLVEYRVKQYKCQTCDFIYEEQINTFDNESFLTPSLAANIVNNKYNYALPLYCQEAMFTQLGAPISRQSLANYCIEIAEKLEPIYNLLKEKLLDSNIPVRHADETSYKVLELKNKKKCYIWLYANTLYDNPIYIYEYQESRGEEHPQLFFKGYSGYLVCDDLKSYDNIENVKTCRCWFHAKKKYADLIKTLNDEQKKVSLAVIIHNMISNIFHIENQIQEKAQSIEQIEKLRFEKLKPLVDEYFAFIKEKYEKVDHSSVLGKAIKYSINNELDLCRFFECGYIPLSNNLAERAIKPFVILRKNCLFSKTEKGAQASAILMSIIQTAKMNLFKPDEYIKYVLERIDDTKTSELENLLPINSDLPEYLRYKNSDIS